MISLSNTKSSSNWLDRLRSSKGFPTGEEPALDKFLATSSSGSAPITSGSTHSGSTQSLSVTRNRNPEQNDNQLISKVSNVLCELFNMGSDYTESSRNFPKKSSRKQANPRFCGASYKGVNENNELLCSSDDLRRDKSENGLASSGDNSLNERKERGDLRFNGAEVEDRGNHQNVDDLKSYSRSEVTVIDTSFQEWKFDRWVFRKNDEWVIKEKKIKSRAFGRKKRKLLVSSIDDDDDKLKKKQKKDDDDESLLLLNKEQPKNSKDEQHIKETADFTGKAPQKRFPCPRPPEKFRREGSSVILLKSIPPSAAIKLGKISHKKRRKQMKIV